MLSAKCQMRSSHRGRAAWSSIVVFAGNAVPANAHDLHRHLQAIAQRADLGALVMRPPHCNLRRAETAPIRQEQQLRIKCPALDALLGEDGQRSAPGESFEAA